ncbi:hypothetical protein [Spirillospora sp. NPDC029432]|uniref:hypothetical protein n=1 Tax=Spirillospora sp. NPDC029432 TaxID=3154599 RepID=UPI003456BB8A
MPLLALWLLAVTGWLAVTLGLARAPAGFARRTALLAHLMTGPGVVLFCAVTGFGSLHGTIALAAEWWALILVTGLRPGRLLATGTLPRLAAWAAAAAALALLATRWMPGI